MIIQWAHVKYTLFWIKGSQTIQEPGREISWGIQLLVPERWGSPSGQAWLPRPSALCYHPTSSTWPLNFSMHSVSLLASIIPECKTEYQVFPAQNEWGQAQQMSLAPRYSLGRWSPENDPNGRSLFFHKCSYMSLPSWGQHSSGERQRGKYTHINVPTELQHERSSTKGGDRGWCLQGNLIKVK